MPGKRPPAGYCAGRWVFVQKGERRVFLCEANEAGKVPLANVVAIGTSAKNIVLIGDKMQLAQPTQGVHPGDTGLSALEYLLGEHATVPPEYGIFLDRTYRMHSNVCGFISTAFYDGRLKPEAGNERQRLVLGAKPDAALAP